MYAMCIFIAISFRAIRRDVRDARSPKELKYFGFENCLVLLWFWVRKYLKFISVYGFKN